MRRTLPPPVAWGRVRRTRWSGGRSDQRQRSFLVVVVPETEPSVVIVIRVKCERRWIAQLQHNAFTLLRGEGFPTSECRPACIYFVSHGVHAAGGHALHQVQPVHSSQQKELKSISSAKVMCSWSWVNKNGNNFITIISSSRWWKWKVSPVCAVSGLTNGNSNFNIKKPRESSRRPENRREAQRIVEKPWENPRSLKQPREASRRPEKTWESSTWGFYEFREGSLSALLFVCLPPDSRASENYGLDVKKRNRSKTRSFFHVIRLYCYPNSFSNISDLSLIGYNIHLHYMIVLYIEHWKVVM